VHVVATAAGRDLLARRERAGDAWLAERLGALGDEDRRALERAVVVLEALATERPGDAAAAVGARRTAREDAR
jgi:hypothetical protein